MKKLTLHKNNTEHGEEHKNKQVEHRVDRGIQHRRESAQDLQAHSKCFQCARWLNILHTTNTKWFPRWENKHV